MKYSVYVFILSILLSFPLTAHAKEQNPGEGRDLRAQAPESLCEAHQNRIDVRLRNFQNHRVGLLRRFDNLLERLRNLLDAANGFELDTTTFSAQIEELDIMVDDLSVEYETFITLLQDAKNIACEDDPQGFKDAMAAARAQLDLVHQMAQDIRMYYIDTVKPTLLDLKAQIEALKEEGRSEEQ